MTTRREEIDEALERLRRLSDQLTDQPTQQGIEQLIADLEAEKVALDQLPDVPTSDG